MQNAENILTENLKALALTTVRLGHDGALDTAMQRPLAQQLCAGLNARGIDCSWAPDHDDAQLAWVYVTLAPEMTNKFQVQVRGDFGGTSDGWRPAITGTLNQTGQGDDYASTAESYGEAQELLGMVHAAGASADDTRVIEVE